MIMTSHLQVFIVQASLGDSGKAISWDELVANYDGKNIHETLDVYRNTI
jgi:hypothetical protein